MFGNTLVLFTNRLDISTRTPTCYCWFKHWTFLIGPAIAFLEVGQLRGHLNLEPQRHIQNGWMVGGALAKTAMVYTQERCCWSSPVLQKMAEDQSLWSMTGRDLWTECEETDILAAAYRYLSFETNSSRRPRRPSIEPEPASLSGHKLMPWPILSSTW